MESLYDVCFAGELLEGQQMQDVRQRVQKLFNANPETLDKLFSGKTQLVKRGCNEATAAKYQQAMERAGALAVVRSRDASPPPPEPATVTETPTAETGSDETGLILAPAGEDILRPEERATPVATKIDTSGIELTDTGTTLSDTKIAPQAAPDTNHLSMGEVGEDIPNLADTRILLKPNIDDISLSPEGTDFTDCAAPLADALDLDLSSIEIAPTGSDVLEEQYRKADEGKAPDTAHINLAD